MTDPSPGRTDEALTDETAADAEAEELLSLIQHMSTFRGPANRVDLPDPVDPLARGEGVAIQPDDVLPPTIARPGARAVRAHDPDADSDAPADRSHAMPADAQSAADDQADQQVGAARPLARTQARTRALEFLFAAEVRERPAEELLDAPDAGWVDDFTHTLVATVVAHAGQLDEIIEKFARGWTVDRMPNVDRCILRMGLAELMHLDEVPPRVAIDEAVQLAKVLSTDDSPKFVNGLLAAVARDRELL